MAHPALDRNVVFQFSFLWMWLLIHEPHICCDFETLDTLHASSGIMWWVCSLNGLLLLNLSCMKSLPKDILPKILHWMSVRIRKFWYGHILLRPMDAGLTVLWPYCSRKTRKTPNNKSSCDISRTTTPSNKNLPVYALNKLHFIAQHLPWHKNNIVSICRCKSLTRKPVCWEDKLLEQITLLWIPCK